MRAGVIARKLGMSRIYVQSGEAVPLTLLKIEDCVVAGINDFDKSGQQINVQVAAVKKNRNVPKPQRAALGKLNIESRAKINEFRVSRQAGALGVGQEISAEHFVLGQYVDVVGITKGKGFAGVMKRHNFRGLEASHGVSISHRSHGSTGQRQDPGKVFKGKKMAGHMGVKRCTVQNLEIMYVDVEKNVVGVCGAVPGHKESLIFVQDALKKALPAEAPFPIFVKVVGNDGAEAAN